METHGKLGNSSPPVSKSTSSSNTQGMATLIVMIAVLLIIILFCCFAAPGVRMMCKRYVFRRCMGNDPNIDNVFARRYGYDTRDEIKEINELKQKIHEQKKPVPQQ